MEKTAKSKTQAVSGTSTRGTMQTTDGLVVSNKMNKTVVVAVTSQVKHAKYGKFVRRTSKCYAHDEKGECNVGDLVRIVACRPLSRLKRWRVQSILRKEA